MTLPIVIYFFCLIPAFAQIRVVAPPAAVNLISSLPGVKNSIIPGSTATFGVPYYGKTVFGQLYYNKTYGHSFCNIDDFMDIEEEADTQRYSIFLVVRGGCTFVKKVSLAEKKGADAVIVIDNKNRTPREIEHIIMADDGWGKSIKIPSILIASVYGEKLKLAVSTMEKAILLELEWAIPSALVVDVDFWASAGNKEGNRFLASYAAWAGKLSDYLHFRIRSYIYGISEPDENSMCWNTDRDLCADDPDGPGPLTGSDVLTEDVRRRCLYEATAVPSNVDSEKRISYLLWEYLYLYEKECPILDSDDPRQKTLIADYRFGISCSNRVIGMLKGGSKSHSTVPTPETLQDCHNSKGKDYLMEDKQNSAWAPLAMRINGWRYAGPLYAPTVTSAVCTAFKTLPTECENLEDPNYIEKLMHPNTGSNWYLWTLLILLIFGISGVVFWLVFNGREKRLRTSIRQDVVSEVRIQMSERYHQLVDDENSAFYAGSSAKSGVMPFP